MSEINLQSKIFIKLLEFGEKNGLEGAEEAQLNEWAVTEGFLQKSDNSIENKLKMNAFRKLYNECFESTELYTGDDGKRKYVLKNAYYFRLVEYRELQESRRASTSANRNAFFAISISIIAIFVGIFCTYNQLNSSISIDTKQFNSLIQSSKPPVNQIVSLNPDDLKALVEANERDGVQNVELSKLQMAQILSAITRGKPKRIHKPEIQRPSNEEAMLDVINRYYEQ